MMKNAEDYLLIENALTMHSKSPLTQIYSCVICTKNHFFVVPTKSVGTFVIFNTIKDHAFFQGMTILEGLKKLITETEKVEELEVKLSQILESNDNYVYMLSEAKSLKIKSFLGKKTFMYRKGKSWASFNPKSKDEGKAMATFYSHI
jgi:hypothetical protein